MASLTSSYCHVCGKTLEDININEKRKLSVIFHPHLTANAKKLKKGKNKKGKIKKNPIEKEEDISYSNITEGCKFMTKTKEGQFLEKIVGRRLQYRLIYNSVCPKCVGQIHQYIDLSKELEHLRIEVKRVYDAANPQRIQKRQKSAISKTNRSIGTYRDRNKLKISNELQNKQYVRKTNSGSTVNMQQRCNPNIKLDSSSEYENETTSTSVPIYQDFVNDETEHDENDRINIFPSPNRHSVILENNIIKPSISKRRSTRIKINATQAEKMVKNEGTNNPKIIPDEHSGSMVAKDVEQNLPNKKLPGSQNLEHENDINEKYIDMKHIQLRQNSIMERSTSHPCEICK